MDDLTQRLRAEITRTVDLDILHQEAADEINALRHVFGEATVMVDRLTAERDALRAEVEALRTYLDTAQRRASELGAEVEGLRADALRYRWLRDVSVPPHNFYLSVPVEFDGVRYTSAEVDAAIDTAIAARKP